MCQGTAESLILGIARFRWARSCRRPARFLGAERSVQLTLIDGLSYHKGLGPWIRDESAMWIRLADLSAKMLWPECPAETLPECDLLTNRSSKVLPRHHNCGKT